MKSLVITADDFGAAVEVNEAVEIAYRDGILTAASLMVSASAADDAVERARRLPALGVGLHLVLVEGRPTLPASRIPDLVDATGSLRTDMATMGLQIALSRRVREQLSAEIEAQFCAFDATGLRLDHVNAHKHFHVHPVIGRLVMDAAIRHGARALRVPREQGKPQGFGWVAAPFIRSLARRARQRGFVIPDRVHGLRHSGQMTIARVREAIASSPHGVSELYLHPATDDRHPAHTKGYAHRGEFDALLSAECRQAVAHGDVRLCNFASLA
jgi:hopanoid biosynthesis associated protein HpnK